MILESPPLCFLNKNFYRAWDSQSLEVFKEGVLGLKMTASSIKALFNIVGRHIQFTV